MKSKKTSQIYYFIFIVSFYIFAQTFKLIASEPSTESTFLEKINSSLLKNRILANKHEDSYFAKGFIYAFVSETIEEEIKEAEKAYNDLLSESDPDLISLELFDGFLEGYTYQSAINEIDKQTTIEFKNLTGNDLKAEYARGITTFKEKTQTYILPIRRFYDHEENKITIDLSVIIFGAANKTEYNKNQTDVNERILLKDRRLFVTKNIQNLTTDFFKQKTLAAHTSSDSCTSVSSTDIAEKHAARVATSIQATLEPATSVPTIDFTALLLQIIDSSLFIKSDDEAMKLFQCHPFLQGFVCGLNSHKYSKDLNFTKYLEVLYYNILKDELKSSAQASGATLPSILLDGFIEGLHIKNEYPSFDIKWWELNEAIKAINSRKQILGTEVHTAASTLCAGLNNLLSTKAYSEKKFFEITHGIVENLALIRVSNAAQAIRMSERQSTANLIDRLFPKIQSPFTNISSEAAKKPLTALQKKLQLRKTAATTASAGAGTEFTESELLAQEEARQAAEAELLAMDTTAKKAVKQVAKPQKELVPKQQPTALTKKSDAKTKKAESERKAAEDIIEAKRTAKASRKEMERLHIEELAAKKLFLKQQEIEAAQRNIEKKRLAKETQAKAKQLKEEAATTKRLADDAALQSLDAAKAKQIEEQIKAENLRKQADATRAEERQAMIESLKLSSIILDKSIEKKNRVAAQRVAAQRVAAQSVTVQSVTTQTAQRVTAQTSQTAQTVATQRVVAQKAIPATAESAALTARAASSSIKQKKQPQSLKKRWPLLKRPSPLNTRYNAPVSPEFQVPPAQFAHPVQFMNPMFWQFPPMHYPRMYPPMMMLPPQMQWSMRMPYEQDPSFTPPTETSAALSFDFPAAMPSHVIDVLSFENGEASGKAEYEIHKDSPNMKKHVLRNMLDQLTHYKKISLEFTNARSPIPAGIMDQINNCRGFISAFREAELAELRATKTESEIP